MKNLEYKVHNLMEFGSNKCNKPTMIKVIKIMNYHIFTFWWPKCETIVKIKTSMKKISHEIFWLNICTLTFWYNSHRVGNIEHTDHIITHFRIQDHFMIKRGCKNHNYNREYEFTKYRISHDRLKISTCTSTFSSKEEYYDTSDNSTKRATRREILNSLTIFI